MGRPDNAARFDAAVPRRADSYMLAFIAAIIGLFIMADAHQRNPCSFIQPAA